MNCQKLRQQTIALGLTLFLLVGCGAPAPTPTPPPPGPPKAGHWEGQPSVSFDLTADGKIHNFVIVIPFQDGSCTKELVQEMIVGVDGTFAAEIVTVTEEHIDGKFDSATTVVGTFLFKLCEDVFAVPGSEGDWSAEWVQP